MLLTLRRQERFSLCTERCQSSAHHGQLRTLDAEGMRDRFREAMFEQLTSLKYDSDGEAPFLLFENEWIRMHLVRFQEDRAHVLIEVEMSLPESGCKENQQDFKRMLQNSIEYFRYMEELSNNRFTLSVVGNDCLWIASILISKDTQDLAFFELLISP
jgi:hypothetical protein